MQLLEQPIDEIVARHHGHAGKPRLVDREAVGFVVARMAKNVGNSKPVADAALGRQQVDPWAKAFKRNVLRADDDRVPGLIEVFHGVNQRLDVLLDGDATDVDQHLVLGSQAERRPQLVAIDQWIDSSGVASVGNDLHLVADMLREVVPHRLVHADDGRPE